MDEIPTLLPVERNAREGSERLSELVPAACGGHSECGEPDPQGHAPNTFYELTASRMRRNASTNSSSLVA